MYRLVISYTTDINHVLTKLFSKDTLVGSTKFNLQSDQKVAWPSELILWDWFDSKFFKEILWLMPWWICYKAGKCILCSSSKDLDGNPSTYYYNDWTKNSVHVNVMTLFKESNSTTWQNLKIGVSEWLLFSGNSAIFQLYNGENKLIFNEMMRSALY